MYSKIGIAFQWNGCLGLFCLFLFWNRYNRMTLNYFNQLFVANFFSCWYGQCLSKVLIKFKKNTMQMLKNIFFSSDLTRHLVSDYAAIEHLMEQGNTHRYIELTLQA